MKNSLGIYFGSKVINIVEAKGKKIIKNIQISLANLSDSITEEKVPEEIKITALLKEELQKNKIESKDAVITLSATDLIIRTFEIPLVSAAERSNTLSLEIKKYIPFRIEDLVSDFQFHLDSVNRRYLVLYAGIMKENMEKYLTILKELDIKTNNIEYSAFSIFRLIGLAGLDEKGIVGIINIDSDEEKTADFTVMENGFPLFTRDIKLMVESQEPSEILEESDKISERLKTEIRISLDYYKRKFPAKQFNQIYFIGNTDIQLSIQAFLQELGLSFNFVDTAKIMDKSFVFNLGLLKAYCSAISNTIKATIKLNISSAWEKSKRTKEAALQKTKTEAVNLLSSLLKTIDPKIVVLGILICVSVYGIILFKKIPLKKEIQDVTSQRPQVPGINLAANKDELSQIEQSYKQKIDTIDNLLRKQLYLTPKFSVIPDLLPEGIWLTNFSFTKTDKVSFKLEGFVYKEDDSNLELESLNNFLLSLQKDPNFNKNFKEITLDSVDRQDIDNKKVTHFLIIGKDI